MQNVTSGISELTCRAAIDLMPLSVEISKVKSEVGKLTEAMDLTPLSHDIQKVKLGIDELAVASDILPLLKMVKAGVEGLSPLVNQTLVEVRMSKPHNLAEIQKMSRER